MSDRSPQTLWETALGQLELHITRPNFDTWLRDTIGLRIDDGRFVVGVPSDFAIVWLQSRLSPLIDRTISELLGSPLSTSFEVLGAQLTPTIASQNGHDPSSTASPPAPRLNRRLIFDSFTVVDSNRLAYRAARRIASGENTYNPLILYGPPGLGKTHLLHAIAHEAVASSKCVILLTCKDFAELYAKTVQAGQRHTFLDAYRDCDLLLLDDLQFLATRPGSQEQFFHIFNTLYSADRPLILTSDSSPKALRGLSPQLQSRLQAGLTVELRPPSADERLSILRQKAQHLKQAIPNPILELIAQQPYHHVRELEGALKQVIARGDLAGKPLTLKLASEALAPLPSSPSRPSTNDILHTVCRHFHLSPEQLTGPSRARDITYARHIAMYLVRLHTQRPLAEIGKLFGNRDHSTVLHGCRRIEQELTSLPQTHTDIQQLQAAL